MKTVPTYLQTGVREIILIDDCSTDNTPEIAEKLIAQFPNQIRYFRQPRNMKQTAAKNRGISEVKTEWVYFGDDDSLLAPHSIEYLYDTAVKTGAGIVGARALYMVQGEDMLTLEKVIEKNTRYASSINEIADVNKLTANFGLAWHGMAEVPFCQACLLMQTGLANKVRFDEGYIGNAYREETDFIIRCAKEGAKIMYDSRAVQYNLPASLATGGARGKSVWKYKWYCVRNNWRFLKKNWSFIQSKYNVSSSAFKVQMNFCLGYVSRPLLRLCKTGHLKSH